MVFYGQTATAAAPVNPVRSAYCHTGRPGAERSAPVPSLPESIRHRPAVTCEWHSGLAAVAGRPAGVSRLARDCSAAFFSLCARYHPARSNTARQHSVQPLTQVYASADTARRYWPEQYRPAPHPQKKPHPPVTGCRENCAATAVPWITDAGLRVYPAESSASARVAKRAAATPHTNILIAGGHSHGKPNASRSAF